MENIEKAAISQEEIDICKDRKYQVPAGLSHEDRIYYIMAKLEKQKAELLYACEEMLRMVKDFGIREPNNMTRCMRTLILCEDEIRKARR